MKSLRYFSAIFFSTLFLPFFSHAQTVTGTVQQMHIVLQNVYNQMIVLSSQITGVCQGIASIGTTFYIGYRVWKHLANAEPIDFFPLLRPFVITILITMFPQVLGVINGILEPSVTATAALVQHSTDAVQSLLANEVNNTNQTTLTPIVGPNTTSGEPNWDTYTQPSSTDNSSGGGILSAIGDGFKFLAGAYVTSMGFLFKFLLSIFLETLYFAASLCIDALRTFHLIVLAILGPFAFAFSCFDSMHHSLQHWLARYINVFLWLPICNIFGAILGLIEQNMIQFNEAGGTLSGFSPTNIAYLIFLVMGIVGYLTVPSIANYIVHTHGPNPIAQKISQLSQMAISAGAAVATGGTSAGASAAASSSGGGSSSFASSGNAGAGQDPNQFNRDRIAG